MTHMDAYKFGYAYGLLEREIEAGQNNALKKQVGIGTLSFDRAMVRPAKELYALLLRPDIMRFLDDRKPCESKIRALIDTDATEENEDIIPAALQSSWCIGRYHAASGSEPHFTADGETIGAPKKKPDEKATMQALRKMAGLTQKEAAKKMGCTQVEISLWETGKRAPTVETIKRLAQLYQCAVDDLI